MISDKLSAKESVVTETADAAVLDMGDRIAALVFRGDGSIGSKTADWAAKALKEIETNYNGLVILGSGENLCCRTHMENDEEPYDCARAFQSLTSTIRHYSKPVVTILKGMSLGIGYEIALNSHAVLADPTGLKFGYDCSQGLSPMGGGLTAQALETYAKGDNVPGLDMVPFLKSLLNKVCFPVKAENAYDAKAKGLLPANTVFVKENDDAVQKGKQKSLNMFAEGFEPIDFKTAEVLGTTGRAALEIIAVNSHEGLFISDETYDVALKVVSVICGGDVPKKTIIDEKQFLRLEAECFAETWKSKRNEVAI
ncbi:MAG: hypothetical protein AAGU76_13620 [Sedimentibacter sp.]|uniref:hypothetical protein n=1 Tax=Sedimentibacter sp. TaxID=1960295 RepID=UPI003158A05B